MNSASASGSGDDDSRSLTLGGHVGSIGEGRGRITSAREGELSAGGWICEQLLAASGMGFGVVTPYLLKYSPTTLTTNTNPDSDQNPNPLRILSESPHSPRLALDAVLPPPASTLDVSIDIRANGGSYNLATDTRDGRDETAAAGSRSTTSGLGRWNSGNALQDGRRIQFAMLLRGEGEREREQDEEQDEIPPTYESFDT